MFILSFILKKTFFLLQSADKVTSDANCTNGCTVALTLAPYNNYCIHFAVSLCSTIPDN